MDFSDRSSASASALQKGANQQFQSDIIRLDNDCEHIQGLIKEGENPLNYQQVIQTFLDRNKQLCQKLVKAVEFKNSFFVYRKLEKVLLPLLKLMEVYDDQNFPIQSINNQLAQQILEIDTAKISKLPIELVIKKLPQKYLSAYDFSSNILSNIISSFNNQGTIYMLRGKADVALNCFAKALEGRQKFLNSYQHNYQLSILFLNIAFCYKNKENYEESSKLLNKAILMLENIEKISKEFQESENLVESSSYLLCLIETKESEFCKKQSEVLFKQFKKKSGSTFSSTNTSMQQIERPSSRSGSSSVHNQIQTPQSINQQYYDDSKMDDNFSQASFQTVNTTQSYAAFGGSNISKDNIIFQKYILSRRLQIEKGQLKIRDMEFYNSVEDYSKNSKVLPANLTNIQK